MATDPFAGFEEVKPGAPAAVSAANSSDPYAGFEEIDPRVLEMPDYANGLNPEAAINKSPLSATDRLVIKGLGNRQEDIEKSLKQRFSQVNKGEDGEFRVKDKDGLWYQVDPNTLNDRDAIDVTRGILRGAASMMASGVMSAINLANKPMEMLFGQKNAFSANPLKNAETVAGDDAVAREMVGEIAENVDTAAMVAAGTAAAPLTGGASLGTIGTAALINGSAAAATKLGLTSLGRLQNTYDAPVEEQLKDAGYEFGLGLLGTYIPAGVRFGLDKFAAKNVAANATKVLSQAPEEKLGMIKNFFDGVVDDVSIDRLATPGNKVQTYINQKAAKGGNLLKFQDEMRLDMVGRIKEVAQEAVEGLDGVYRNQVDTFLTKVPADLNVNTRGMLKPIRDKMAINGLASVDDAGNLVIKPFNDLVKAEGARQLKGSAQEVAFDKKTYDGLTELVEGMNRMSRRTGITGKEAVSEMMADQRILKNITKKLRQQGKGARPGEIENNVLYRVASEYGEALKNSLPEVLGKDLGPELRSINSTYKSLKDVVKPLEGALSNDTKALQLATALTGKSAAGTLNRATLPNVVQNFTQYGGSKGKAVAEKLVSLADDVSDMKAAIQFTAPMRAQFGPFQAGMAANMAGDALQNQSVKGASALGMAANVLSKYPKAAKMAVETQLAATRMLEQSTKRMSSAERAKFLFDGNVLESFGRAFTAPFLRAQTEETLMNQATGGGQP